MQQLHAELESLGIISDVHHGHGAALLSVWVDLLVWSDGFHFRWWNGEHSARTGRRKYAAHPAENPATAARRIATRYADLRTTHPEPPLRALSAEAAPL
ncbi:hypothetical protein [Streptosporangium sp. NBC_01469]|uniref:hypothetical protein n=1 Tax=Streptosporangium sp. NBC_01469 TaxID=2903898 RepID=UPI002E2C848D|nr:hypothetical protein [Streptosporangium sp. NBC_01469]